VPVPAQVLGTDTDERILWLLDRDGRLVGADLESRGVRTQLEDISTGVLGPDGSLFLADLDNRIVHVARRQPVRFHERLPEQPRALFGASNDQLVAITAGDPPQLIAASADQALQTAQIPAGEVTATVWGDLVAVAGDSALVLYETGGQRTSRSIETARKARRVRFSPSGHRIYVSQDRGDIRVFDRFTLEERPAIRLPTAPGDFRLDASGRWLLAQAPSADTVWVVDLATGAGTLAAAIPGTWRADLPLVAGAATLVTRVGTGIEAFDLRRAPPVRLAVLDAAAEDYWLAAAWVPPERVPAAVAAAESATVIQDSGLLVETPQQATVPPPEVLYLQISRTQNPEWAELLTRQLKDGGHPASVLPPGEPEDGYRVIVGPYPNREAAESAGKLLGRAYFLLRLPARRP
jgi:hypothetical protein